MKRFFSLLFIPQEKNNHRALLLQPSFLAIFIAVYLLNQSLLRSLTILRPGILGYSSEITADKVLTLTNSERQKQNLPALRYNPTLSASAALKAKDMFTNNYWAHTSPIGVSPWDFFHQVNYQYSVAGENLARDFYDPESLLRAWMNSPTHRENIVNPKYQEIGIGVVNGVLGGVKTTLVVQHFGTPLYATRKVQVTPKASKILAEESISTNLPSEEKLISPLAITKAVSAVMFVIILTVLIVDAYITLKNRTHRLAGSATSHVGFLAIIMLLMLFSQQGSIF